MITAMKNQYGEYSQNRETGDEPYKKINRRYLQRIKTAAETFLDADWDGVRISGGKNLNFLNGEVTVLYTIWLSRVRSWDSMDSSW
mgnify:CR=1 FL=1